jgi:membrane-associated phospholipid phosphatase
MPLAAAADPRGIVGRLPRDRRTWTLLSLLAVLVGSVLAFANITEDYLTKDPLVDWDVRFASWLHAHSTEWLVSVFKVVTWAGNSAVLIVVVGALAVLFVRRGRVNDAAVLIAALGGAGVINALLKLVFQRPRPELAYIHLETYSFPSGHAAVATATFTTLAFVLGRRSGGRRTIAIAAAAAALIALVGFSRLYLGVHYLSDVLAGTSFGLAWASLCLIAYTLYGDRSIRLPLLSARASARPRP